MSHSGCTLVRHFEPHVHHIYYLCCREAFATLAKIAFFITTHHSYVYVPGADKIN